MQVYRQNGYKHAVNSINKLIKTSTAQAKELNDKSLAINTRGECCEILLEIQILEYAKRKNLPWLLSKGLTIPRKDGKKNATTELDLTLFTPSRVVLFESKYRQGKIKLIDECTIVPNYGNVTNVYKQNLMHMDNLRHYLSDAIISLKRGSPFSLALYVDETKRVTDNREQKFKKIIPLVGSENIFSYLDLLASMNLKIWNMKKIQEIMVKLDKESDKLFEQHLERMNPNGNNNKH